MTPTSCFGTRRVGYVGVDGASRQFAVISQTDPRPSEMTRSRWSRLRWPRRELSEGLVDFVDRCLKRTSSRLKKCLQRLPLLVSQGVVVDRIYNICSTHGFIPYGYPDMKNGKTSGAIVHYREVAVKRLPSGQFIVEAVSLLPRGPACGIDTAKFLVLARSASTSSSLNHPSTGQASSQDLLPL